MRFDANISMKRKIWHNQTLGYKTISIGLFVMVYSRSHANRQLKITKALPNKSGYHSEPRNPRPPPLPTPCHQLLLRQRRTWQVLHAWHICHRCPGCAGCFWVIRNDKRGLWLVISTALPARLAFAPQIRLGREYGVRIRYD